MSIELVHMVEFLSAYKRPGFKLFRRNVINKTVQDLHTGRVHQLKAGIVGQCDVYGFVKFSRGFAIPVEIEFKGYKTKTEDEQNKWRVWCESMGIPHIQLRVCKNAKIGVETTFESTCRWTDELNAFVDELLK